MGKKKSQLSRQEIGIQQISRTKLASAVIGTIDELTEMSWTESLLYISLTFPSGANSD